jgi:hypothetical protein
MKKVFTSLSLAFLFCSTPSVIFASTSIFVASSDTIQPDPDVAALPVKPVALADSNKQTPPVVNALTDTSKSILPAQKVEMTYEGGKEFDYGKLRLGDTPSHTFIFKNTGNVDIEIDLVSGCTCTDIEWSKNKIKPGDTGYIKTTFNANKAYPEHMNEKLHRDITIVLKNTHPDSDYNIIDELFLDAFVSDN